MSNHDVLREALDLIDEIVLGGMSGTGMESEEAMNAWHAKQAWRFISIAAQVKEKLKALAASKPEQKARPCRSPYCECEKGKCTHPGFYDARHETEQQAQAEPTGTCCYGGKRTKHACGDCAAWKPEQQAQLNGPTGVSGTGHAPQAQAEPEMERLAELYRNSEYDQLRLWRELNAKDIEIAKLREAADVALEALERLAKLGNGDSYGNSIGNQIAIDAITNIKEARG